MMPQAAFFGRYDMKRRFWSVALALCLCLTLLPGMARAAATSVTNEEQLSTAVANGGEVQLADDIMINSTLTIESGNNVVLDLNGHTLSSTQIDEVLFEINGETTLTIKDSGTGGTIDGKNQNSGIDVSGGTLILESGIIENCMEDGDGGAVDVSSSGQFIMNGGLIRNCKANDDGGAVDIGANCVFTMNGGTIQNCSADDEGGAIMVKSNATFSMHGDAKIENCKAAFGGGISIGENGAFTMEGGTIIGCSSNFSEDAIYARQGAIVTSAYTVTFESDGGSSVLPQLCANAPATKPADPSKVGYTFAGWYNGDTPWNFGTPVTESMTLTAHWTPNTHTYYNTIHYWQNPEKNGYETASAIGDWGTTDTEVTATPYNYTGFTFNAAKSNTTGRIAGDGSLVLRLYYDRNSYTLTFDTDGGSEVAPITQAYGTAITAPAAPTKPGYIFAGWDKEIPANMPAENMIVTAKWSPVYIPTVPSYGVSAPKAANGTVSVSPANAVKGATVTVTVTPDKGCTLETLTVTDKDGNSLPLNDKGGGKYTFTMPGSAVTVTATFMEDNAMLNFFVDVPASAYYYDAVLWAAENGITGGTDAVHFSPDASCTRAQLVTFLYRAAGSPVVNYAMDFSDVSGDDYYAEAVRWAASLGIVGGYGDGSFGSGDTVTREQVAVMLYRFAKAQSKDVSVGEDTNILSYTDALSISDYAFPAMQWACGAGVMQGTDGSLLPQDACTRAQIATLLFRALAEK